MPLTVPTMCYTFTMKENRKMVATYDVYGNEHLADADKLKLSVHVYGLARRDDKILISPQWDIGYDFPGGTADRGETHIETLIREYKEETGYDVEPLRLLGVYTSFFHHHLRKIDYQSYIIYYEVKIVGGELSNAGFDEDEKGYAELAKWVPIDSLKDQKFASSLDISAELIAKLLESHE